MHPTGQHTLCISSIALGVLALVFFAGSVVIWLEPFLGAALCFLSPEPAAYCVDALSRHPRWRELSVVALWWALAGTYVSLRLMLDAIQMYGLTKRVPFPSMFLRDHSVRRTAFTIAAFHLLHFALLAHLPSLVSALYQVVVRDTKPFLFFPVVNAPMSYLVLAVLSLPVLWRLNACRQRLYL
ncbi:hypothetical protein BTO32_14770 [Marinobacter lutaoensis]|uniref:Uncharacterized protein n=1 Tax=Marinobacter lutaoensis TaxID=135739 RepID=A0A1V2DPB2_9GAMM|nr:hypothetical protein [Marinobacter lutaoensis]ONF42474.1 hypothetical protein BTO32_14770 [Marinobacter lutaoensis]